MEIINIFKQGNGGTITVEHDGFSFNEVMVDNQKTNFVKYIEDNKIDTRLPLVANYFGANINVSFQAVDRKNNLVDFYAPLRKGIEYKLARSIGNYVEEFQKHIPLDNDNIIISCNCILNYLYGEQEGKKTGNIKGPFTFGEIAYVLVNQTLVYLSAE